MAIHDDNWTTEFSIWQEYRRNVDWSTVIPILIIFAVVAYSAAG